MFKNTFAVLVLLMAALFTSCAGQNQNASVSQVNQGLKTSTIIGGVLADHDFQKEHGIVQLAIYAADGDSGCTGTLISSDIVLTAGHCLLGEIQAIVVVFATDLNVTQDQYTVAIQADVHPDFPPKEDATGWNDIALLKLQKPAPSDFKFANLPTAETIKELKAGSKVLLAGYGNTNPIVREYVKDDKGEIVKDENGYPVMTEPVFEEGGTLRKILDIPVVAVTEDHKEFLLDQTDLRGACHGDSGGPALLQLKDGSYIQVGVTSRGTNELGNCNEGAIYTGVYGQLTYIAEAIEKLNKAETTPVVDKPTAPVAATP